MLGLVNRRGETASWHGTEESLLLDVSAPPMSLSQSLPRRGIML